MKQIFTIIMSLQLLLLPIAPAYAKEGEASTANQLLALGTTIIGSNILTTCKLGSSTPSLLTFFGGSLVFIASEILGAKAQKAFIEVKKDEVQQLKATMKEGGDLQRKILESKLSDEEAKLEFVQKRKKWTTAVTAIFYAATALAVMEGLCVYNPFTAPECPHWAMAACDAPSSLASGELTTWLIVGAYGLGTSSAGGGSISSYGSLLYTAISLIVKSTGSIVATAYNNPIGRAITFGAAGILAQVTVQDLSKIEGDLEDNIKEIKAIIADFKETTTDPNGLDDDKLAIELASNVNGQQAGANVKRMNRGADLNKSCWGKDEKGNQTYSEGACKSPVKVARPRFNPNFQLPVLESVANTSAEMADAVARGDMAAADVHAGTLASNAMRVKQIRDNLMNQFNEQSKKQGKKGIDFDKAIQDRIASMNNNLNKGLASRGMTLASLAPSNSISKDKKEPEEVKQEIKTAASEETIATDPQDDFNFSIDEGVDEDMAIAQDATPAPTHTLEDFETQESDILAKPEVSIFDQLSNRYFLNYKRIFKVQEPSQAAN
ncbi:MAG TPA: hypothetical protein VKY27_00060 [Bacteriovoracaceae bacterium]|nr:hypothetical protein [Bacteriovoracaceae bacterium]